jgi:hypothetical protein
MADEALASSKPAEPAGPIAASAVAVALVLDEAKTDASLRDTAAKFLEEQVALTKKQASLTGLQEHHLHDESKHQHLALIEERIKIAWKLLTTLVVFLILGGMIWAVWEASQQRGLTIEAFGVPEDMAKQGFTGEVIASQILDRLNILQFETTGSAGLNAYGKGSRDDLRVEIPETGISLGEVFRFLAERLGSTTKVSGEVVTTKTGVKLTARPAGGEAFAVEGPVEEFDALVDRLAEGLLKQTQPWRYAEYLDRHGRDAEARDVLLGAVTKGLSIDRALAWNELGRLLRQTDGLSAQRQTFEEGLRLHPTFFFLQVNLGNVDQEGGHWETALADYRKASAFINASDHGGVASDFADINHVILVSKMGNINGDFGSAADGYQRVIDFGPMGVSPAVLRAALAQAYIGLHDFKRARKVLQEQDDFVEPKALADKLEMDVATGNWPALRDNAKAMDGVVATFPGFATLLPTFRTIWLALAAAKQGDSDAAEKMIGDTALDCYPCLLMRGRIAALRSDTAATDKWFAEALRQGPSLPFAEAEWGGALLARGDVPGAIAKVTVANKKGPHFADPFKVWGDALTATGDFKGAVAKYTEADKYAPNWSENHLHWSQALEKAGKHDEAVKHAAIAAELKE